MCSTAAQRIAEIGRAIDDLAVKARPGSEADAEAATSDTGPIVARLAELWALLAELDPEVARRLVGYQNLSALTDLQRAIIGHHHSGPRPSAPVIRAPLISGHAIRPLTTLTTRLTAGTGPPVAR